MTIFDIMPTWLVYVLTGIAVLIPTAIAVGIIVLIILAIKALVRYLKK